MHFSAEIKAAPGTAMRTIKNYFSRAVFGKSGGFAYPETPSSRDRFVSRYIENAKRRKKKRSEELAVKLLGESGEDIHRVLEVGCGPGYLIRKLVSDRTPPFILAVGVDREFRFLRHQAKQHDGSAPQLVLNENGNLPFRNETFDLVVCEECLHGWSNPEFMLREMLRVLAPEGRMRIFDIDPSSLFFRTVFAKKFLFHRVGLIPLSTPDRWFCHSMIHGFTKKELAARLENLANADFRFLSRSRWFDIEITRRRG